VLKNGYTIIVEHDEYNEIITVKKSRENKNKNRIEEAQGESLPVINQ